MPRTRIKICGVRNAEIAHAAVDAGADAVGFMFVRSSVRAIDPDDAAEIMWSLPPMVTTVGVFMNASVDTFLEFEERCPNAPRPVARQRG
jgi:phosphoribosylanthranilate isomerase